MNPLNSQQVRELIRVVDQTREVEITCSECRDAVGEYLERRLAGLPIDAALERVEHHFTLCPECREEFEALKKVLNATG